jgi:hypothetical protein
MAIRTEDLLPDAVVLAFPPDRTRATRRARMLSRRRRTVGVAAAGSLLVATLLGGGSGGTAPASSEGAPRRVVVRAGDTLWRLAERYASPGSDARAYVDALVELNGLEGPLRAGRRIALPR